MHVMTYLIQVNELHAWIALCNSGAVHNATHWIAMEMQFIYPPLNELHYTIENGVYVHYAIHRSAFTSRSEGIPVLNRDLLNCRSSRDGIRDWQWLMRAMLRPATAFMGILNQTTPPDRRFAPSRRTAKWHDENVHETRFERRGSTERESSESNTCANWEYVFWRDPRPL
jgi:hypothetical protein